MSQGPTPFMNSIPPFTEPKYSHSVSSRTLRHPCGKSTSPSHGSLPPSPAPSQKEHRVSKAKKGKRVHACEFSGCGKVFTRAEHRRRHELSHNSKKSHVCSHEGCNKAFHRSDYLSQHMARHDPHYPSKRPPSMKRTDPASSPVTLTQQEQASFNSLMLSEYLSPPQSVDMVTPSSPAHFMTFALSPCYSCQHHGQNVVIRNSVYNYPLNMDQTPLSQLEVGVGSDIALDQYLRSVLRPGAFLAPREPQTEMNSFFGASLDPNLPLVNPLSFQDSKVYSSWNSAPDSMSTTVTANRLACTPPSQPQ